MNEVKEITLLFPEGKEVKVGKETVRIMPIGFGKFPRALKIMDGLKLDDTAEMDGRTLFNIVKNNADAILDLCALGAGVTREQLEDLPMDQGLELVQAILEVNVDFFAQALLPKITQMTTKLVQSTEQLSASVGAK